jgi:hypothetical protein
MVYPVSPKPSNGVKAIKVPPIISTRVGDLEPVVRIWMRRNRNASISRLVRAGVIKELKPYAGKRYAHLVQE